VDGAGYLEKLLQAAAAEEAPAEVAARALPQQPRLSHVLVKSTDALLVAMLSQLAADATPLSATPFAATAAAAPAAPAAAADAAACAIRLSSDAVRKAAEALAHAAGLADATAMMCDIPGRVLDPPSHTHWLWSTVGKSHNQWVCALTCEMLNACKDYAPANAPKDNGPLRALRVLSGRQPSLARELLCPALLECLQGDGLNDSLPRPLAGAITSVFDEALSTARSPTAHQLAAVGVLVGVLLTPRACTMVACAACAPKEQHHWGRVDLYKILLISKRQIHACFLVCMKLTL
jgi:hypothetical protein